MTDARAYRRSDIDMLRGLGIAIMAIDHTRDYLLAGTVQDPGCQSGHLRGHLLHALDHALLRAGVRVLAGTSAGLMAARRSPSCWEASC